MRLVREGRHRRFCGHDEGWQANNDGAQENLSVLPPNLGGYFRNRQDFLREDLTMPMESARMIRGIPERPELDALHPEMSQQVIHSLVEATSRDLPIHPPYRMPPANPHLRREAYEKLQYRFQHCCNLEWDGTEYANKIIHDYWVDRGWIGG
jgi:hypothetical protein